MGRALYRTYRPRRLSDVVGQEHITKTLEQALKQHKISHAYLFTGPRGVGKTSVARILAHAINDLPYTDDSPQLDIIEIDAASNRRIDEIRDLREKIHVAPAVAKYKVYIIDEVHMLTREAFNALLKTLEEPPAHVVFILATTDAHKLPDTIISRTQRFSFKPVEKQKVAAHLKEIAKQENLKSSDEVFELLAEHGEGSFRDSISLFDQAGAGGEIRLEDVQLLLGVPPEAAIGKLLDLTLSGSGGSVELMRSLADLYGQGYQASAIAKRLGAAIRAQLVSGNQQPAALALLKRLVEVPGSFDPEQSLEIALLDSQPTQKVQAVSEDDSKSAAVEPPKRSAGKQEAAKPEPQQVAKATVLDADAWPEVLRLLKQRHNTLYGVVRMAQPDFSTPGMLRLTFAFAFHQKRLEENANREKLAGIIQEVTGQTVSIEGRHDKNAVPPAAPALSEDQPDGDLALINNIFGQAELLES